MKDSSKPETKNKISSFINKVIENEKIIELTGSLIGIVIVIHSIINYAYNFTFQKDCEQFYNVPGKYFSDDIRENLVFMGAIMLLMSFAVAPVIMRKYDIKKGIETRGSLVFNIMFTIALGGVIGIVNAYNLVIIMKRTNHSFVKDFINSYSIPTTIFIAAMFVISMICVLLMREIKSLKNKVVQKVIKGAFFVALVFSALLMVRGIWLKLETKPKDFTEYEFAERDNERYIVLTDYKDKKVVMKYYEDNGVVYIKTDKYYFIDDQATFSYKDLEVPPKRENID